MFSNKLSSNRLFNKALSNRKLLNGLLFQAGWFACVLGGDSIALLAVATVLLLHGLFFIEYKREWYFIIGMALAGIVLDSALTAFGIFLFAIPSLGYIPIWLACLWFIFATTFNHSLVWLQHRLPLAALLGAVSGTGSYYAGTKLAPVALADPLWLSILQISVCWAILMPLLCLLSRRVSV